MLVIMIPKAKELKLISIYLYIGDIYDSKLFSACERFSNNNDPDLTDQEVLTIYLYTMNVEQRLKIKQIHGYASDHLRSIFLLLPSYDAFLMRICLSQKAFSLPRLLSIDSIRVVFPTCLGPITTIAFPEPNRL